MTVKQNPKQFNSSIWFIMLIQIGTIREIDFWLPSSWEEGIFLFHYVHCACHPPQKWPIFSMFWNYLKLKKRFPGNNFDFTNFTKKCYGLRNIFPYITANRNFVVILWRFRMDYCHSYFFSLLSGWMKQQEWLDIIYTTMMIIFNIPR